MWNPLGSLLDDACGRTRTARGHNPRQGAGEESQAMLSPALESCSFSLNMEPELPRLSLSQLFPSQGSLRHRIDPES